MFERGERDPAAPLLPVGGGGGRRLIIAMLESPRGVRKKPKGLVHLYYIDKEAVSLKDQVAAG